jgi:hypothetical protein
MMLPTATLFPPSSPRRSRDPVFLVAEDVIDLGHVCKCLGLGLRRATRHDDARRWLLAADFSDRLSRLTYRFGGDRTGVDNNGVAFTGRTTDHFRLVGIQPAAEGDDVKAHATLTFANRPGSNVPSYSNSTGPVMST